MSHWNGKVWYAYGTSITSVEVGKYAQYLEKISGMELHNRGIGGGGITNLGGYSKGQVKAAIMSLEDGKALLESLEYTEAIWVFEDGTKISSDGFGIYTEK